jgi:hypothetical protein
MYLKSIGCIGMDWIKLAEERIQGCVLVNKMIHLVVWLRDRNFFMSVYLSVFKEGTPTMKLRN